MVKKKKASKKGVNKSDNNFNRNLLIGAVILILIFVVAFNFAGKGSDEEGLGQSVPGVEEGEKSGQSSSIPRCKPLNGGKVENSPCKCGTTICNDENDICTPYANHCQGGPKIFPPDPNLLCGQDYAKRQCEYGFDCIGVKNYPREPLRLCMGKVKYKIITYDDECNDPPGCCSIKSVGEYDCPVHMECIKNHRIGGIGDRCGFRGTPDVEELGDFTAYVYSFIQLRPYKNNILPAYILVKAKVNGMKQFAGQKVTITMLSGKIHRTDDVVKIFGIDNFFGRSDFEGNTNSIAVVVITLDKDGNGEGLLSFDIGALPFPSDGGIPAKITIPSGTYQLSSYIYMQPGDYSLDEMLQMTDYGSRGNLDPFFVVP